jgi:hypothetical protein
MILGGMLNGCMLYRQMEQFVLSQFDVLAYAFAGCAPRVVGIQGTTPYPHSLHAHTRSMVTSWRL